MLASIYIYGHLVAATASFVMALAFAVSAARVPGARTDSWFTLTFTLTASTALTEMGTAMTPTLGWARVMLASEAILVFFIAVSFHAQYAHDVFTPRGRRIHRRGVVAYAAFCALCVALIIGGVADGGRLFALERWGIRSAYISLPPWAFALFLAYCLCSFALEAPLLLGGGLRAAERRAVAAPVLAVPLVGLHELLIGLGVNPMVPVGGYWCAFAGMVGAFVLAERLRSLLGTATVVVGNYTIERRIGSGGMADVYLARRGGQPGGVVQRVALKRLRTEHLDDPSFARMFLDEARIAARLVHPNIVTLLDVGESDGELYLAMELVDGAPLSSMLQLARRRGLIIGDAAAVEVTLQLADALSYAHAMTDDSGRSLELVHRDVSPHNVLIDRAGHVKLADFGIARSLLRDGQTRTGVLKGKISYMAPEQVSTSKYDQRVDVYALGVVLFEMLSGRVPYHGSSEPTILRRLLDKDPEPFRRANGLPAPLGPIVRWATDPTPSTRAATAAAVYERLLPLRDEARGRAELCRLVADAMAAAEQRHDEDAPTVAT